MIGRKPLTVIMVLGLICLASCVSMKVDLDSEILADIPARNRTEEDEINARLVELGPTAIMRVCKRLAPTGVGDDSKARYILSGLATYANRPGAETERGMVAPALAEALRRRSGDEVKAFLIRQLQRIGGRESVAPLARFLRDDTLCEPATQALLTIRAPGAETAFLRALPRVEDANRVTIINALGAVRSEAAVKRLLKYTSSEDADVRRAALHALANIGDPAATPALAEAAETTSAYDRAKATSFYLLFAARLAEEGETQQCEAICRYLFDTRTDPLEKNVRCAALSTLVAALGSNALDDLLATADIDDAEIRAAALDLAADITGSKATARWVDKMRQTPPGTRSEIATMLARRGDKSAMPALLEALREEDKSVRLAAVPATARLGGDNAIPALLEFLQTEDADEIDVAQGVLEHFGGSYVIPAVAEALPRVSSPARVALLEVLAARRAYRYRETVFAMTRDDDSLVRVAALKALEPLTDEEDLPRLIGLLLDATADAERSAAQELVVSIARRIPDPEKRADQILAALERTTDKKKGHLLPVLAGVGGNRALQVAVSESESADAGLQDAAVRALADWPDVSAAAHLLNIAQTSSDLTHHVLAVQGFLRLAATAELSEEEAFRMYKDAMAAARRPEEKKLVLAGLAAQVRTVEALELVGACLEDEALQAEAVLAAVEIACPHYGRAQGLQGDEVTTTLKKVLTVTEEVAARERVQECLEGFVSLFNGEDLAGWTGDTGGYFVEDGRIIGRSGGNLYTEQEYSDFALRFEFRLSRGANSGLGIRAPLEGDPAYAGIEIQILDDTADIYKDLQPYQYHGSIYGVVPAKRGYLNPVREWNLEEVIARGRRITVNLNGTTIVNADIREASTPKTIDGREHPGLKRTTGHIGFLGHGSRIQFRNIRVKKLK
jgi:HEAT repeat protein